jgi:hypothetical protein
MSSYPMPCPAVRRNVTRIGALGLLFTAGAAPVLSIPVQVFGLLPLTVT